MLVLSREVNQTIIITAPDGTRITLMLIEVRGDKSRIGIAAPVEYTIHRGEVQERVDGEATESKKESDRQTSQSKGGQPDT